MLHTLAKNIILMSIIYLTELDFFFIYRRWFISALRKIISMDMCFSCILLSLHFIFNHYYFIIFFIILVVIIRFHFHDHVLLYRYSCTNFFYFKKGLCNFYVYSGLTPNLLDFSLSGWCNVILLYLFILFFLFYEVLNAI